MYNYIIQWVKDDIPFKEKNNIYIAWPDNDIKNGKAISQVAYLIICFVMFQIKQLLFHFTK
jgi:hypothetical protein